MITSPASRLCHWGPLASVAITASITFATVSTGISYPIILLFQMTTCLALYNMWCATMIEPGYMSPSSPNGSPKSDRYCRRCCQIVRMKHHHCPWINNCVGGNNEQYFIRFLWFSLAVTIQSTAILIFNTYFHHHMYHTIMNVFLFTNLINIGLSVGVLIAVSVLLYTH